MASKFETDERSYLVRETEAGVFITDQDTKRQFFRTRSGGWFWLAGSNCPFDEDVTITGNHAEYLESLVDTLKQEKM